MSIDDTELESGGVKRNPDGLPAHWPFDLQKACFDNPWEYLVGISGGLQFIAEGAHEVGGQGEYVCFTGVQLLKPTRGDAASFGRRGITVRVSAIRFIADGGH